MCQARHHVPKDKSLDHTEQEGQSISKVAPDTHIVFETSPGKQDESRRLVHFGRYFKRVFCASWYVHSKPLHTDVLTACWYLLCTRSRNCVWQASTLAGARP
eukprot:6487849-Amphidinium_carterae.1